MSGTSLRPPSTGPPPSPATLDPGPASDPVALLAARVAALESRLDRVESLVGAEAAVPAPVPAPALPPAPEPGTAIGLAGRTLMALGGGYLLRAATEAHVLPGAAGAALGLAYAAAWVLAGSREVRAGRVPSGLLDGITAALVAYPLLWESATRFHSVAPPVALAAAVAFALAAAAAALRQQQPMLAFVHAVAAPGLALALLVASRELLAVAVATAVLHAGSEAARARGGPSGLRWATAPPLDLALLAIVYVAGLPGGLPAGYPPLAPGLAGLAVLGATVALLLHVARRAWSRPLDAFDVVHTPVALSLAIAAVVRLVPPVMPAFGVAALVAAVAIDVALVRRAFVAQNAVLLAAGAAVLALASTAALLPGPARTLAWSALGVAAAWRGRTAPAHRWTASAFVAAALAHGGAATAAVAGVLGPSPSRMPAAAVVSALAALAAWRLQAGAATAAMGALAAVALALRVLPPAGTVANAGGTMALSALAVALLLAGRRAARADVERAGTALLVAGGARVLLVDLPGDAPAPLFLSLVSYGAALRLVQRYRGSAPRTT